MLRTALHALTRLLPPPRIITEDDGDAYLSRWYLLGDRDDTSRFPVNLYLHRFHRSDADLELHSHPWSWALSLILVGGYSEERREGSGVKRRSVLPGSLNFLRGSTFHRVDLFEEDAWSLFLAGPRATSWAFWDRRLDVEIPWDEFIWMNRQIHQEGT